jgi:hypothetical protein
MKKTSKGWRARSAIAGARPQLRQRSARALQRRFRSMRHTFFLKRSLSPCVQICLGNPYNMSDQFLFSQLDRPDTSAWRVA